MDIKEGLRSFHARYCRRRFKAIGEAIGEFAIRTKRGSGRSCSLCSSIEFFGPHLLCYCVFAIAHISFTEYRDKESAAPINILFRYSSASGLNYSNRGSVAKTNKKNVNHSAVANIISCFIPCPIISSTLPFSRTSFSCGITSLTSVLPPLVHSHPC